MHKKNVIIQRIMVAIVVVALIFLAVYLFKTKIGSVKVPSGVTPDGTAEVTDQNPTKDPLIAKLSIPEGFAMQIFAKNLKGARVMAFDPKGRMLVSQTSEGRITILEDMDKDGIADAQRTLVSSLAKPHGMAFDCADTTCTLYVAEHSKLTSFDYGLITGEVSNNKKLLDIPATATDRHFTRTLQFIPNTKTLLISVGSSCNVCEENDSMRGRIMAYDTATKKVSEYARGLRNSVFMAVSPDGKIFATEMGRDGLGDEIPPDEINIIEPGKNYGWPTCYSKNIHDDVYDKRVYIRNPCADPFETPSFIDLQAHSAPLGLAFIPAAWDTESNKLSGSILVAYHGSWNRSEPTGYKIGKITLDKDGNYVDTQDFISGWLTKEGTKLGRPVALVFGPDNALYVSDDDTGNIYRVVKGK